MIIIIIMLMVIVSAIILESICALKDYKDFIYFFAYIVVIYDC